MQFKSYSMHVFMLVIYEQSLEYLYLFEVRKLLNQCGVSWTHGYIIAASWEFIYI